MILQTRKKGSLLEPAGENSLYGISRTLTCAALGTNLCEEKMVISTQIWRLFKNQEFPCFEPRHRMSRLQVNYVKSILSTANAQY